MATVGGHAQGEAQLNTIKIRGTSTAFGVTRTPSTCNR